MFEAAFPFVVALLPVLPPLLLWWRGAGYRSVALHWLLLQVLGGGAVATFVFYVDGLTAMVLKDSSAAVGSPETLAQLRVLLLGAPLSQTLLLLVVLPLRRRRLLTGPRDGMLCAAGAGAGYCSAEALVLLFQPDAVGLSVAQALLAMPAGVFCAGLWGFFLAPRPRFRWSRFVVAWVGAVLLEGLYDHVLFQRGPGFVVALLPLLAVISVGTYVGLRNPGERDSLPSSSHESPSQLRHRPTLSDVTEVLNPQGHRLMILWTALGVLVVFGVTLSALGAAVYLGNRLGMDFARANEADLHANSPLLLLGSAVMVAFPVAGYLITRASGSESVLETAVASGLAILTSASLLSMTEPLALVFVLAVAPVAFSLACTGAWLASRQQRRRSGGDGPISWNPTDSRHGIPPTR